MKLQLVDDIGILWKRWSTRIALSQGGLVLLWISLPQDMRDAVPRKWVAVMVGTFAAAFVTAQSVKQPRLQEKPCIDNEHPEENKGGDDA